MSNLPISRFPIPDINELPKDLQDKILDVQDKAGFIPNIFLALTHRPDEFRAFFAFHDALMQLMGGGMLMVLDGCSAQPEGSL